jgi:hypothetical protein
MNLKQSSLSSSLISKLGDLGIQEVEQLPYLVREASALRKLAMAIDMNPGDLQSLLESVIKNFPDVKHPPIASKSFNFRGLRIPERIKSGTGY